MGDQGEIQDLRPPRQRTACPRNEQNKRLFHLQSTILIVRVICIYAYNLGLARGISHLRSAPPKFWIIAVIRLPIPLIQVILQYAFFSALHGFQNLLIVPYAVFHPFFNLQNQNFDAPHLFELPRKQTNHNVRLRFPHSRDERPCGRQPCEGPSTLPVPLLTDSRLSTGKLALPSFWHPTE